MSMRAFQCGGDSRSLAKFVCAVALVLLIAACATDPADPAGDAVPDPDTEETPEPVDEPPAETRDPVALSFVYSFAASGSALNWVISREMGFFDEFGLDVELLEPGGPGQTILLVGSGDADFGQATLPAILDAREQGVPVVSIGCQFQRSGLGIIAPVEAGVTSPSDLAGMSVAEVGNPTNIAMFQEVLRANGVDEGSVETVIAGGGIAQALATGSVDALVAPRWGTAPDVAAAMAGDPAAFDDAFTFLPIDEWGAPPYALYCNVTNETMLEEHPDVVRDFLTAWENGILWARDNHDEAVEIFSDLHPEEGYELSHERWRVAMTYTETDAALENGYGWQDPDQWAAVAQFMFDNGLSDELVDVSEAFTNDFLPGNSP